jgi:hypothetical protein
VGSRNKIQYWKEKTRSGVNIIMDQYKILCNLQTQVDFIDEGVNLFRPFGPTIYQAKVSDKTLSTLREHIHSIDVDGPVLPTFPIIENKNWVSETRETSNIVKSYDIHDFAHSSSELYDELSSHISAYHVAYYNEPAQVKAYRRKNVDIYSIWANIQGPNEWQPRHIHTKGVSFIVYVDKPDTNDFPHSGDIQFYYGEYQNYSQNIFFYKPEDGDILIFPHWCQHQIIPFTSDVRRVSVAGNAIITSENLE